ncbi:MAG: hypothetical protein IKO00_12655 [Oscillospiraceae bacterium]|nr:hypothetical protein [Oscillospiraceae bacterium]
MTFKELVTQLTVGNVAAGIAILLSLIQISPLKLNPWDKLLAWFGRKLNGATIKKLEELQKQVRDMWINTHRQSILTFARECRADMHHDAEEWNHILSIADEYEVYCAKNTVSNGVVKADTEYVRALYQELSREHKI